MAKTSDVPAQTDYLVIGAGIAGLAAAYTLKRNGRKVVTLEAASVPAGRMGSESHDRVIYDLGAQFLTPSYKNILRCARELNVPITNLPADSVSVNCDGRIYDIPARSIAGLLTYRGLSWQSRVRLLRTMLVFVLTYRFQSMESIDYRSAEKVFAKKAGHEAVQNLVDPLINGLAFYRAKDTSMYFLAASLPKILRFRGLSFQRGVGELAERLAKDAGVIYDSNVTSIKREAGGVKVTVRRGTKTHPITARRVIVAVPGDKVLSLLQNPTGAEKAFFPHVAYSATVVIHCRAKTSLFNNRWAIWYQPHQEKEFACVHHNPHQPAGGKTYFVVSLASDYARTLMAQKKLQQPRLAKLIQTKLPDLEGLEILRVVPWPSAVAIFQPGYMSKLAAFTAKAQTDSQIHYCGDYIGGGFTEDALTSGLHAAEKALAD